MTGTFGRSELKGATPQSSITIHGWPSLIFGIPFLIAGVAIFLVSIEVIPVDPGSVHAPMWVLSAAGAMFAFPGIILMVHGVRGLARKTRLEKGRAHSPNSPWLWDFDWEPLGISENKQKEILNHFFAAAFFLIFLVPFNWWAFLSKEGTGFVIAIVCFFDLIAVIVIGRAIYKLFQFFKYGNSRLTFGDFPLRLGNKARLTLNGLPLQMDQLTLDLRCVEEAYEMRGSGKNRRQQVVCYARYRETKTFEQQSSRGQLKMEWELPEDVELTTHLSERPASFWELVVDAETQGIDYHARFLLPVYSKR